MPIRGVESRSTSTDAAKSFAKVEPTKLGLFPATRGLFEQGNAVPDMLPSYRVRSSPLCLVDRDRRLALAAWICSALRRWNRASSTARPARALRHLSDDDVPALGEQLLQLLLGGCTRGTWEGTAERGRSREGKVSERGAKPL